MKALTEKQMHTKLNNYYKKHYGENDFDEWAVNPAPNRWKFKRNGKTVVLVCDKQSGKVFEE